MAIDWHELFFNDQVNYLYKNPLPSVVPSHITNIWKAYPIAEFDMRLNISFVFRDISSYKTCVSMYTEYVINHAKPINDAAVLAETVK